MDDVVSGRFLFHIELNKAQLARQIRCYHFDERIFAYGLERVVEFALFANR